MQRNEQNDRSAYFYWKTITTRWMDNDMYAHVNNVVYYSYFDTVVNTFLIEQELLVPATSSIIGFVVATACDYFEPMSFPDTVHAGLRVAEMRRSSVRYEIGLFRNDDPRAAAQGRFVHVYVDRATRRPVELPPRMRAVLDRISVVSPVAASA